MNGVPNLSNHNPDSDGRDDEEERTDYKELSLREFNTGCQIHCGIELRGLILAKLEVKGLTTSPSKGRARPPTTVFGGMQANQWLWDYSASFSR